MTELDRMAFNDYQTMKLLKKAGFTVDEMAEFMEKDSDWLKKVWAHYNG